MDSGTIRADLAVAEDRLREASKYPAYLLVAGWGVVCAIFFFIDGQNGWGGAFVALALGTGWRGAEKRSERINLVRQVEQMKADFQNALRFESEL